MKFQDDPLGHYGNPSGFDVRLSIGRANWEKFAICDLYNEPLMIYGDKVPVRKTGNLQSAIFGMGKDHNLLRVARNC